MSRIPEEDNAVRDIGYACGKLDQISEDMGELKKRLFGNGQPGEITSIKARIIKLENDYNFRLGRQAAIYTLVGLLSGSASAAVIAFLLRAIFTKG